MSDDDLDELLTGSRGRGQRPGMPVDPGRLLASVKRDWRWIPMAAAIWAALGLLVALLFISHTYKAQTVLVWEPKRDDNRPDERQLATEAGSLKLPGAIRKIRQRLKLSIPIETFQKQIEVTFNTQSNLVTVDADGATARESAVLANTVVAVFLDQQTEVVRARAEDSQRALEKDIRVTQAKLEAARSAYDAFRSENGISDIEQETKDALANIAQLKTEQQQVRADLQNLTSQVVALQEQKKHEPGTMVTPGTTGAAKLAELKAQLQIDSSRYSADHPQILMEKAQIRSLEANPITGAGVMMANPQAQTVSAALSNAIALRDGATARLKSIEESLPKAEERAAWYRSLEGPARGFLADVDLNEKRLVELQSQISKARDAARTPQVEWRVLTPAVEPEWPEKSKRRWIVAGMPILGMIVALLALVIRPLLDGRVYTAREAGYWCNAPVLASTTWPRNNDMLYPLADELIHHGALAPGYTLVVGASPREKAHAEELAYWLGGGERRRNQSAPAGSVHVTAAPSGGVHAAGPGGHPGDVATASAGRSEALMRVPQQAVGAALAQVPQGTHAWLGSTDGPSLRRASRMADRVIVLLTSGSEVFTEVAGLRTRLGREGGVGIVMLGMSSELLKLPDRIGDVEAFWANRIERRIKPGRSRS